MLFRTSDGKLIELNIYSFINDKLYYEKLLDIKHPPVPKSDKAFDYENNKHSNK